ncbi:MAG: tetratricopeptide repeat protein [Acidobacteria bacterium]|nr:tetratricopeptide repeat protein [Acidobacteriota bacterium]
MVNDRGKVIGVAVESLSEGQNLNFAIPLSHVYDLIKTANFPDANENSQDAITHYDEKLPAPWVQNVVAGQGSGNILRSESGTTAAFFFYRGNSNYEKGVLSEAIADYTKAIEIDPQYAVAYYNRGLAT